MAASTLVSLEEYLSTSYEPDREYVDGELVERCVGKFEHSRLQTLIATYFCIKEVEYKIWAFTEQRIQVVNTDYEKRYRIPDVCLVRTPYGQESILTSPPYLVIEILSPDDRASDTLAKTSDYSRFGIPHIWIVDSEQRKLFHADSQGIREQADLIGQLPEIGLTVDFSQFFARISQQ